MPLSLSLVVLRVEQSGWTGAEPLSCHGRAYPLRVGTRLVLGRDPNVDVVLPSMAISRRHAEVYRDEAGVWVRDLDARQRSFVNRQAVPGGEAHPLRPGDDLLMAAARLGLVEFDPSWLGWDGGCVARLAHALREEARYQDLPVVADALEEAGCTDPVILSHCRAGGQHPGGCWVLDVNLGRS